ncbi:MAG: heavy metal-binding domain-containing protein, partial [Gemmatimonadales bacterium]
MRIARTEGDMAGDRRHQHGHEPGHEHEHEDQGHGGHGASCHHGHTHAPTKSAAKAYGPDTYICPMCPGVESEGPAACPKCGMALEPAAPPLQATKTQYTCPMHPEILRDEPGDCPLCGMALEPTTVILDEAPNPELVDMTRRFWVSLVLSLPVFVIAMADLIPGRPLDGLASEGTWGWVQLVIASPVVLWGGKPFFERGWTSLVTRNLNMFTLIAIGTGVAYLYSLVATLVPG